MGYYNKDLELKNIIDIKKDTIYDGIGILNNTLITFDCSSFANLEADEINYISTEKSLEDFIHQEKVDDSNNEKDPYNISYEDKTPLFINNLFKIIIDYQDGITEERFNSNDEQWLIFEHKFQFKDNKFIRNKDDNDFPGEIKLIIFDLVGHKFEILIPFYVFKQSIFESDNSNQAIKLLYANLDNEGKISYIFKINNEVVLAKYLKLD